MLNSLPPTCTDEQWRDLVQLSRHDHISGADVRIAARVYSQGRDDLNNWLDRLQEPPEWRTLLDLDLIKEREARMIRRADHRANFTSYIDAIRAGDYGMVQLAMGYLGRNQDASVDGENATDHLSTWVGEDVANASLIGFENYLNRPDTPPTCDQIANSAAEGRHWPTAYVVVVALAERYRNKVGFSDVDSERLLTALFQLWYTHIDAQAKLDGLEQAVTAEICTRGLWPESIQRFYEPQLQGSKASQVNFYWMTRETSPATTIQSSCFASKWLQQFPDLSEHSESELIVQLLKARRHDELQCLAASKIQALPKNRRPIWDAVCLITDFNITTARIDASPIEPGLLWPVKEVLTEHLVDNHGQLLVPQYEWLIATFRRIWLAAQSPHDGWCGDRNPWDAFSYILHLINRLGNDARDSAAAALSRLSNFPPDESTDHIRAVAAEQRRIRVESNFALPTLDAIEAIMRDRVPQNGADLQVVIEDELQIVQAKIRSDDVESWRGFYSEEGEPYDEERCRNILLGLLRQGTAGITYDLETHVYEEKKVDITCSAGQLRLPVEVKGQWHRDLWNAADQQLDRLYTPDWRAAGRGIYLVLWFGPHVAENKRLRTAGRGVALPQTAADLRSMLSANSAAIRDGRVVAVVMDIERTR
ncbi:hypothetical protein CR152_26990 [Massilia violaceinigra]|uniref:Uncharacterized protein n=1 Tax=Massilia violaceinigra TaxID=2045208 RepID=A0A2D2DRY0_9BURK|nr:hypothetical protein [Massilia violaceinigra]ATQ77742.1 hypothetical protein CR152_26990 [Massilia violaceinigra]